MKDLRTQGIFEKEEAERAAVSVLSHLEERLPPTSVHQMEAQLPSKLRDMMSGHQMNGPRRFHRRDLINMVAGDLGVPALRAEIAAARVLGTVRSHISPGEARKIEDQLPREFRPLWHEV